MAKLYLVKLGEIPPRSEFKNMDVISPERREKMKKYKFDSDAYRCLIGEIIARCAVCREKGINNEDLIFSISESGKPFLEMPAKDRIYFNLSHSGNYVVCLTDRQECGVDVEKIRCDCWEAVKKNFHFLEISQLEKCRGIRELASYFTFLWTMKEAYVKALGRGLLKSFSSFYIYKKGIKVGVFDYEKQDNRFSVCRCLETRDRYMVSSVSGTEVNYIFLNDKEVMNEMERRKGKKYE